MSARGRGPDSTLVHMSPREVEGLQKLAVAHGTTLTINPDTGLPEAFSLKDLLPTLAGAAINYFAPGFGTAIGEMVGLGGAAGTGLAVGAATAALTGDLGKGLSAGLGAYGGAGITDSLAGMGAAQLGSQAVEEGVGQKLSDQALQDSVANRMASSTMADKVGAGLSYAGSNPMSALKIGGKYLAAAAAPIFAGEVGNTVQTTTPQQKPNPGVYHPFTYDPYAQTMTPGKRYTAANGGLMSLAKGGSVGYAAGGVSDAEIKSYIGANIGNPQAIADAAKQYGVSAQDLSRAGGYSLGEVNDYFKNAGINFGGQPDNGQATIINPSSYDPFGGASAYSNPLVNGFGAAQPNAPATPTTPATPSAASVYSTSQGMNLDNTINDWIGRNPNASRATIDQQMQQYGINQSDLEHALQNPAYSANTRAGLLQKNMGLSDLNQGISSWIAANPNATDAQVDDAMAQWGVSGMDVGRALKNTGGSKGLEHSLLAGNSGLSGLNSLITNWLTAHPGATYNEAAAELGVSGLNDADVKRATGKTLSQMFPTPINKASDLVGGAGGASGAAEVGGGTYVNPNGTITTSPVIPGIPKGGFTGMQNVRDTYTKGGGNLGYVPYAPKTVAELNAKYTNAGDSKAMYDYLMGKGPYPTTTGAADVAEQKREPFKPYSEVVGGFVNPNKQYTWNKTSGKYDTNPDYVRQETITDPITKEKSVINYMSINNTKSALDEESPMDIKELTSWAKRNFVDDKTLATVMGITPFQLQKMQFAADKAGAKLDKKKWVKAAEGGLMSLANGGAVRYGTGGSTEGKATEYIDPTTGDKYILDTRYGGGYRKETVVESGITYKWNPVTNKYEVISGGTVTTPVVTTPIIVEPPGDTKPVDRPEGSYDPTSNVNPYTGGIQALANGPLGYVAGKVSGLFAGPRTDQPAPVEDKTGTLAPTPANKAAADYAAEVIAQAEAAAKAAETEGDTTGRANITGTDALANISRDVAARAAKAGMSTEDFADQGMAEVSARAQAAAAAVNNAFNAPSPAEGGPASSGYGSNGPSGDPALNAKGGYIGHYAQGGLGSLGGYSDGGRLLRGPGDGVSDSIPASIGDRQPARLADGEFVVPARIVSELGNGSTEAGARALYKMMDRIQANRRKTTGKNSVAVDSKAHKYLPA